MEGSPKGDEALRVLDGRYRLHAILGAGGFGTVYRARRVDDGAEVAVKILHAPSAPDAQLATHRVQRFLREMDLCARLQHPHIVRFIESGGRDGGEPFAVFELVPGRTLADLLHEDGPPAPEEALRLMLQVLDALRCAHAAGVVHRDIKPSNIIITDVGGRPHAVVVDFGIGALAEELGDHTRLTATGQWLGSPAYSAPEQIAGQAADPRADLYSFGLVLAECITGEQVIRGQSTAAIILQQLGPEPVPVPSELRESSLGRQLDRVLVKDAGKREVTAEELYRALSSCSLDDLGAIPTPRAHRRALRDASTVAEGLLARRRGGPGAASALVSDELRPITVVCCLAEGAGGLLGRAEALAAELGGRILGAAGDRVWLLFGEPVTREDDARRAARAALRLVHDLGGAARAGIDSGLCRGAAPAIDAATADRAARLAAQAPAGAVFAGPDTRALLRRQFSLVEVPAAEAAPRAFRLERETLALETDPSLGDTTRMVGRQQELALLWQGWLAARAGEGQVAVIAGESGIGKSRLLRELGVGVRSGPHRQLACRCVPEAQSSALAPFVELLEQLVQREPGGQWNGLASLLARHGLAADPHLALFGALLSLPADEQHPRPRVSPQRQKELTLNALLALVGAIAERQPLLLVLEDLHWADPTTLELCALLVGEPPANVLCVMSTRPELTAPWPATSVLQIKLGGLSREETRALAQAVAGDGALTPPALETLVERSDGVPLFVEEMAHMLLETPSSGEAIPSSLRALLAARLEQLGRARKTAEVAAAIGREFGEELLIAASTLDGDAVRDDVGRLLASGLAYRKRRAVHQTYLFKHALIRDTAYDACPERRRVEIHARIAAALEARFPEVCATRPDLLAHHHAAAEQRREAVAWAQKAAALALQRSANHEVVLHARKALGWLDANAGESERAAQELAINALLIPALLATRGWVGAEIKETVERSAALLDVERDSPHAVPAQWALLIYHHTRGQRRQAREVATRLVEGARRRGDRDQEVAVLPAYGNCLAVDGDLADGRRACERALELYDAAAHAGQAVVYGLDSRAYAAMTLSYILWLQGNAAQARAQADEAVALAKAVDHASSTALALFYVVMIAQPRGDRETVLAVTEEILEMDRRHGLAAPAAYAAMMRSWALGDLASLEGALAGMMGAGLDLGMSAYRTLPIEIRMGRGELEVALAELRRIEEHARAAGEGYYLPEVLRLQAVCLLGRAPDEAERCLRAALDLARDKGAMLHVLRASHTYARHLASRDRRAAARDLLGQTLEWFRDQPGWRELDEARALCTELGSTPAS
jgi:TOMM system kinase/cyclase fusion protein